MRLTIKGGPSLHCPRLFSKKEPGFGLGVSDCENELLNVKLNLVIAPKQAYGACLTDKKCEYFRE